MIYTEKPENFDPRFTIVSCYVESDGEILLLHRPPHKPQGNTWGVPAGKLETGETIAVAMLRELKQETGIILSYDALTYLELVSVRYEDYDFLYHMYRVQFDIRPEVVINPEEHTAYEWVSPTKAFQKDLIQDLDVCIRRSYELQ